MTCVFLKLSVCVSSSPIYAVHQGLGAYPSASIRTASIPNAIIGLAVDCSPFVYAWSNPFLDFSVAGGNERSPILPVTFR